MLKKEEFIRIWQRIHSSKERRLEEAIGLTTAFTNYAEEYPEFMNMTGLRKAQVLAAFLLEFASRHPYPPEPEDPDAEQTKHWEKMLERKSRLTFALPKGWEVYEDERISNTSYLLFTTIVERLVKKSYDPGIRTYLTEEAKSIVLSIEEIRTDLGLKSMLEAQVIAEKASVEYQHLTLTYERVEDEVIVETSVPAFQYAVASQNSFEAKISREFAIGLTQVWCADKNVWDAGRWK